MLIVLSVTAMLGGVSSKDEIPARYLPILIIVWIAILVISIGILYATRDSEDSAPGQFPTISYTAINFPANRIFAIGLAVECFWFFPPV
jgi:hypothetical protein